LGGRTSSLARLASSGPASRNSISSPSILCHSIKAWETSLVKQLLSISHALWSCCSGILHHHMELAARILEAETLCTRSRCSLPWDYRIFCPVINHSCPTNPLPKSSITLSQCNSNGYQPLNLPMPMDSSNGIPNSNKCRIPWQLSYLASQPSLELIPLRYPHQYFLPVLHLMQTSPILLITSMMYLGSL